MTVYFDDCLSGYDTLEDNIRRSRLIFERLRKHGLVMRSDKYIFGAAQIKALGFGARVCPPHPRKPQFYISR